MQDYIDAKISIEPSISGGVSTEPSIVGAASLNTFKYIDTAPYLILNEGMLVTESGSYIIQEVA
jgi:hypothetical protein